MYWEKEIETMDRGGLEKIQAARLAETMARAKKSVHYGKLFAEMGLDAGAIRTVADVGKLPQSTPHSSGFARLACGAFYEAVLDDRLCHWIGNYEILRRDDDAQ